MISVEYASRDSIRSYGFQTLAAIEEGFEMLGVCILMFALTVSSDVPPATHDPEQPILATRTPLEAPAQQERR